MSTAVARNGAEVRGRPHLTEMGIGVVLVLVGVAVLVAAGDLRGGNVADPLGPRGFPTLLAVGFLVTGVAVAVQGVRQARAHSGGYARTGSAAEADTDDDGPALRLRLLLSSVAVVLYVVVLPVAGFLLTSAAFLAFLIRVQGGAAPRAFVLMVVGFPVAVYVLFGLLLGVPLPPGFFDPGVMLGVV